MRLLDAETAAPEAGDTLLLGAASELARREAAQRELQHRASLTRHVRHTIHRRGGTSCACRGVRARGATILAVAGERVKLVVSARTALGSAESRRLRRRGFIPGVVYGRSEPVAITIGERELRTALTSPAGTHAVIDVEIDGGRSHSVILKDFQRDKVRGQIIHVDLHEVRLDQPIQTTVLVELVGEAPGAKEGGILTQTVSEVNVEALPLEVPQHLEADVSGLGLGDSIRLGDLVLPAGVTLLDDPDAVLASIMHATREAEEAPAAEEGADEGESEAEAELAADGDTASEDS